MKSQTYYWFRDYSPDDRDKMAKSEEAMSDGSFPIKTVADLRNAIQAFGRSKNKTAAKAHIIKRAKALDSTDLLPESWSVKGADMQFTELTPEFLNKLRDLISAKVKDGDLSADDWNQAVKTARAHAGGMGKAKKKKDAMPMTASEGSLTDMIREVDSALYTKYPDPRGGSLYWSREVFLDYVIVCEGATQRFYQIPYAHNLQGEIEFGEPIEVTEETEYLPVELSEICSHDKGSMRLFVELPEVYAEPPDWIPVMPMPGTYQHPEYGTIKLTQDRLDNFLANFELAVYDQQLPISPGHDEKKMQTEGAQGYIVKMRKNENGSLDGQVEWSDLGDTAIRNNRFRYISPEWKDDYQDRFGKKHKDVLLGAALTPRPYFKESSMRSLVASERGFEIGHREQDPDGSITFVFTAATPIQQEVAMPLDKEARRKRFAEIAKGFKGEVDTHLTFMEAIAGDNEKPEDLPVFKAYVAREIELAKEPDAPKQFAELQAEVTRLATENKTKDETIKQATERVTAVEKDLRKKRFADVVKDFSGKTEKHVSMLEFIADNEEKGEESDRFKEYVTDQSALSEQLKASDLFRSMGDDRGEIKTAAEELDALAQKYVEDHKEEKGLTRAIAYSRICDLHPEVYNRHRAETRKGVN